jgi:hypothetical protein
MAMKKLLILLMFAQGGFACGADEGARGADLTKLSLFDLALLSEVESEGFDVVEYNIKHGLYNGLCPKHSRRTLFHVSRSIPKENSSPVYAPARNELFRRAYAQGTFDDVLSRRYINSLPMLIGSGYDIDLIRFSIQKSDGFLEAKATAREEDFAKATKNLHKRFLRLFPQQPIKQLQ